jgi:hypothetical protein
MEIQIRETCLKVFENGDIFRIDKRCPQKGYVKCELTPKRGYLRIGIDGKDLFIHRIVASCFLGLDLEDLTQIVDHWDRVKTNNNVSNLTITTTQGNGFNTDAKHYCFNKSKNRWIVTFRIDGKSFNLGCFMTELEAIEKAKDVSKFQIVGDKYIKAEDVVIPKIIKDLKPDKSGKYTAQKIINGTHHYIGRFDTSAEARFAMDNFTI